MKQIILSLLLCLGIHAAAQSTSKHLNLKDGAALDGYDPVAYFKNHKAERGNAKFSVKYNGASYFFVSKENKDAFQKSPTAFEPQYGGWCAFAMGDYGEKVDVDPETFKILDGKLYLFYNAYFNNTLKSWNKDEARLKAKADSNWANFLKK